jgi:hypothetical protein
MKRKAIFAAAAILAALIGIAQSILIPSYKLKLAWDASPSPSAVGYIVYSCTQSNGTFEPVGVTSSLDWSIPKSMAGQWFYATAFDAFGLESDPSNVVQGPNRPIKPVNPRFTP